MEKSRVNRQQEVEKLDYKRSFLIGFGFFASSLLWSLYNSFVPPLLEGFIESTTIIGIIMTIDNIFGVIFQPFFGTLSDRTNTRIGKRMPYIVTIAPISALLFFLVPYMPNLGLLMLVLIVFNFTMSVWRSPMISLMPDLTPEPLWSKANGVINLMGGVGSIIAFLVGGRIANSLGRGATFAMGSIITVIAVLVLFLFVKEKQGYSHPQESEDEMKKASIASFLTLEKSKRKRLLFLLLAIFFWFCAFNAIETYFTLFAVNELGLSEGSGAMLLAFFSVSFVVFAIPSGFIASKIGKVKSITIGLVGLLAVFIPLNLIMNITAIRVLLLVGGFFWAMININSLPLVLNLGSNNEIGTYTGYYYFFSFSASIVSPILFGAIRDVTQDYGNLFIYAPICFVFSLLCILSYQRTELEKQ